MRPSRSRALSLGDDREKLVAKFNRAHPQPGFLTRIVDRVVEVLAAFETKWSRPEETEEASVGVETRSNRATIGAFAFTAILYPYVGRIDRAPLFFGAMAAITFLLRWWTLWHRSHPPIKDADSKAAGIFPALLQGVIAFSTLMLFNAALKYSMADPSMTSDLNALLVSSGAGVFVYQRRTGWRHYDPEAGIIVVFVAIIFSGLWTAGSYFLGKH